MTYKENILQELHIVEKDLLTEYKKKHYNDVFVAEKNLLDRIKDIIKTDQTHPLLKLV